MTKDLKHLIYYRFNTGPVGKGPGDWTLSGGLGDLLDLDGFITASTTIEHNGHTAESVSMGFRYLLSPTAERGCDPRWFMLMGVQRMPWLILDQADFMSLTIAEQLRGKLTTLRSH